MASEVLIQRPLQEVFDFVTDAENDRLWVGFARDARKLTPGPVGLGTRFHQRGEVLGVQICTDWEITEFEPCRRMVGEARTGSVVFRGIYDFRPAPDGTRMGKSGTIEFQGLLAIGEPFLSALFQNALNADLKGLKALLEQRENKAIQQAC